MNVSFRVRPNTRPTSPTQPAKDRGYSKLSTFLEESEGHLRNLETELRHNALSNLWRKRKFSDFSQTLNVDNEKDCLGNEACPSFTQSAVLLVSSLFYQTCARPMMPNSKNLPSVSFSWRRAQSAGGGRQCQESLAPRLANSGCHKLRQRELVFLNA